MIRLNVGPKLRQYIAVILADLTLFQVGMDVAWLSPLLIQLKDANQAVLPQIITDEHAAWLISICNLGATSALVYVGYLADRLGRKYTIILGNVPKILNCVMFLVATDVWMLMLGRFLSGMSDAFCCSVTFSYASEIASKEFRGRLGSLSQIMSALGSMLILCTGPFLSYMTLCTIITCIDVVTLIPLMFLPESPYLLYAKGRIKESTAVLTSLRSKDAIEEELTEYSINIRNSAEINKFALLKDIVVLKTIGKVTILAIGSQMTGFNAVMFYLQSIFQSTGTTLRPEISSAIIGCVQLLACFVNLAISDRFGRKPILSCSLIGLTMGMVGMGTFYKLKDGQYDMDGFLNYLPLVSLMLVIFCYDAGVGSLIWSLCAELFDGPCRAMGVSYAVFIATLCNFPATLYFNSLSMLIGPAIVYWTFGACCIPFCLFIIFCIPETKGKAFSEIQREMGRKNSAFEGTDSI